MSVEDDVAAGKLVGRAADKVEAADDPRVDRGRSAVEYIDLTLDDPLRREDTMILPTPDDPLPVMREDTSRSTPDDSRVRKRPLVFDAEPPAML